jgi:hypothetical protein
MALAHGTKTGRVLINQNLNEGAGSPRNGLPYAEPQLAAERPPLAFGLLSLDEASRNGSLRRLFLCLGVTLRKANAQDSKVVIFA